MLITSTTLAKDVNVGDEFIGSPSEYGQYFYNKIVAKRETKARIFFTAERHYRDNQGHVTIQPMIELAGKKHTSPFGEY